MGFGDVWFVTLFYTVQTTSSVACIKLLSIKIVEYRAPQECVGWRCMTTLLDYCGIAFNRILRERGVSRRIFVRTPPQANTHFLK